MPSAKCMEIATFWIRRVLSLIHVSRAHCVRVMRWCCLAQWVCECRLGTSATGARIKDGVMNRELHRGQRRMSLEKTMNKNLVCVCRESTTMQKLQIFMSGGENFISLLAFLYWWISKSFGFDADADAAYTCLIFFTPFVFLLIFLPLCPKIQGGGSGC